MKENKLSLLTDLKVPVVRSLAVGNKHTAIVNMDQSVWTIGSNKHG